MLNSTIIINNIPRNFRLLKENTILIIYDLMKILIKIAKDGCNERVSLKNIMMK